MLTNIWFVLFLFNKGMVEALNKPNILLIFVDDLRHLSKSEVILPNIKKITGAGVYFKNAFAQVKF